MKLSNTMIMNCEVMPTKKAFTLAEVLITLSILGVVAALTIPSLVNRQSEMAAIVKLKKAISQFEQVAEVYMAENDATDMRDMIGASCAELPKYFKIVGGSGCTFTTADGVEWDFTYDANTPASNIAVVYDSSNSPKYGVAMRADDGAANKTAVTGFNSPTFEAKADIYSAADFLKISKPADFTATGHPTPIVEKGWAVE